MEPKVESVVPDDLEILVRRWGPTRYAAYCPQLRIMVKGNSHEEVEMLLVARIRQQMEQRGGSPEGEGQKRR